MGFDFGQVQFGDEEIDLLVQIAALPKMKKDFNPHIDSFVGDWQYKTEFYNHESFIKRGLIQRGFRTLDAAELVGIPNILWKGHRNLDTIIEYNQKDCIIVATQFGEVDDVKSEILNIITNHFTWEDKMLEPAIQVLLFKKLPKDVDPHPSYDTVEFQSVFYLSYTEGKWNIDREESSYPIPRGKQTLIALHPKFTLDSTFDELFKDELPPKTIIYNCTQSENGIKIPMSMNIDMLSTIIDSMKLECIILNGIQAWSDDTWGNDLEAVSRLLKKLSYEKDIKIFAIALVDDVEDKTLIDRLKKFNSIDRLIWNPSYNV